MILLKFTQVGNRMQGLKYLKMSTTHREERWRGEGPERGTEECREGWGLGRGAVAPPQYAPRKF